MYASKLSLILIALLTSVFVANAHAADDEKETSSEKAKTVEAKFMRGFISVQLPESWKSKQPRSRIVEREFEIPKAKGDEIAGRMTGMLSGGSLSLNINRWYGQFTQPDGKSTKDVAKVTSKKIGDVPVTMVDIAGTYTETVGGGPFSGGKKVQRPGYRMLAAIIQAKELAPRFYFVKLYGPEKTIEAAQKPFQAMIESITVQKPQ